MLQRSLLLWSRYAPLGSSPALQPQGERRIATPKSKVVTQVLEREEDDESNENKDNNKSLLQTTTTTRTRTDLLLERRADEEEESRKFISRSNAQQRDQREFRHRLQAAEKNHEWVASTIKAQLAQNQRLRDAQQRAARQNEDGDEDGEEENSGGDFDVRMADIDNNPDLLSHELVRTKLLRAMKAIEVDEIPDLDWQQRKLLLQAISQKIIASGNSHNSWNEKAIAMTHLHRTMVEPLKLRLTPDIYSQIFHVIATALTIDGATASGVSKAYARGGAAGGGDQGRQRTLEVVARQSVQPHPYLQQSWDLYQYMVDSGVTPTAETFRDLFFILATFKGKDPTIEAKAHALYVDSSHAGIEILPAVALQCYFTIMGCNGGSMHVAVNILADYRTRLESQPTPGMLTAVVTGLLRNHQVSEALNLISTLHSVPIRSDLLKAMLRVMKKTSDPLSAIAFYKAAGFGKGHVLTPDVTVFSILFSALSAGEAIFQERQAVQLAASERRGASSPNNDGQSAAAAAANKSPYHRHLLFLMQEMKQYGVKATSSGKIKAVVLEGLESIGRPDLAAVIEEVARERDQL